MWENKVARKTGVPHAEVKRIYEGLKVEFGITSEKAATIRQLARTHSYVDIESVTGVPVGMLSRYTRGVTRGPATNYALSTTGKNTLSPKCTGCGAHLYQGESIPCTLCLIRESVARGGEHTNVELASPEECYEAMKSVTLAAGTNSSHAEAVSEPRWTLTTKAREYMPTPAEIEAATAELREKHLAEKLLEPSPAEREQAKQARRKLRLAKV